MAGLGDSAYKIKVFVGSKQSRLSLDLASSLQPLGTAVEYVQIEGSGRNALDLHIAYYIGRLAVQEPGCVFHIVSKDTDYDPLIDHLRRQRIACHRWPSVTEIQNAKHVVPKAASSVKSPAKPSVKAAPKPRATIASEPNRVEEVIDNLVRRARARPSTLKSLTSTIKSHFRKADLSDAAVLEIIDLLERRGVIVMKDGKVTYRLPQPTK